MCYTDDPIADFNNWDREREKQKERLPCCEKCGEPIDQEDAVHLGDEWYCDDCLYKSRTVIEVDW